MYKPKNRHYQFISISNACSLRFLIVECKVLHLLNYGKQIIIKIAIMINAIIIPSNNLLTVLFEFALINLRSDVYTFTG